MRVIHMIALDKGVRNTGKAWKRSERADREQNAEGSELLGR